MKFAFEIVMEVDTEAAASEIIFETGASIDPALIAEQDKMCAEPEYTDYLLEILRAGYGSTGITFRSVTRIE